MTPAIVRSPLFYVGDKYRLMPQLVSVFPAGINCFYEPFVGGGTVFLNVDANRYYLNDLDQHLIGIHQYLAAMAMAPGKFFADLDRLVQEFNLSRSYKEDIVPEHLKRAHKKTYYARFNKAGYERLREHTNLHHNADPLILYVLLIYGFNRMLRFNRAGQFNLPVGNVDFNKNVVRALRNYFGFMQRKTTRFSTHDFRGFLANREFGKNDFVYLDPPYLIAASEYNKLWAEHDEADLLDLLDDLHRQRVRFALSNITHYNGSTNELLIGWMKKYECHSIQSNYISYHNNGKKQLNEVLVTNYQVPRHG